jgi:hypothetical protein
MQCEDEVGGIEKGGEDIREELCLGSIAPLALSFVLGT